jgi:hypothetical protein
MKIFQLIILFSLVQLLVTSCKSPEKKEVINKEIKYSDINLEEIGSSDFLFSVSTSEDFQLGDTFAFIDKNQDTIISEREYIGTYTDTLKYFAIVYDQDLGIIGVDRNNQILFEIFQYDNGPDYLSEGYFRVIRHGKIGYANSMGEVKILCQFDCAFPFENGQAKVSDNCEKLKDGEYTRWESKAWFYIDKNGNRIKR